MEQQLLPHLQTQTLLSDNALTSHPYKADGNNSRHRKHPITVGVAMQEAGIPEYVKARCAELGIEIPKETKLESLKERAVPMAGQPNSVGLWIRLTPRNHAEASAWMARYGWLDRYIRATWEGAQENININVSEWQGYIRKATKGEVSYGAYISGGYGVGKTSLMALLARYVATYYDTPPVFFSPTTFASVKMDERKDSMTQYTHAPILFMDDMGNSRNTDYIAEMWRELIEYRYARQMLTIISSNLTLSELKKFPQWARIASCLSLEEWMREFVLMGKDRRSKYATR